MVHHTQTNNSAAAASSGTVEKVYECGVCMKTFSKHSSWWKHKKCHTGERAYKCYICEKSFTQQANLHRVHFHNYSISISISKSVFSITHNLFLFTLICSTCTCIQEKSHTLVKFVINASHKQPTS